MKIDVNLLKPIWDYYKINSDQWLKLLQEQSIFLYSSALTLHPPQLGGDITPIDINYLTTEEREDLRGLFKSENNE